MSKGVFTDVGNRWMLWYYGIRGGKKTKIPYSITLEKDADSTNPTEWASLANAKERLRKQGHPTKTFKGLGVALGRISDDLWLVGIDLDLARDKETGSVSEWAQAYLDRLVSYTEVSPSGTGFKVYGLVNGTNYPGHAKRKFPDAPRVTGDHDTPEIEMFSRERYFCVTGSHVPGTPLELRDITEAWEEVFAEIDGNRATPEKADVDPEDVVFGDGTLPDPVMSLLLGARPDLGEAFFAGEKMTGGGDTSRSGKDMSMVLRLISCGISKRDAIFTLPAFPGGQFYVDYPEALTDSAAEHRIKRILGGLPSPKATAEEEFAPDLGEWNEEAARKVADAIPPIKEDWEEVLDAAIAEMNEKFFVADLEGKTVVGRAKYDDVLKRNRMIYSSFDDIRRFYLTEKLQVGWKKPKSANSIPERKIEDKGSAWLKHPDRRTYSAVKLMPSGNCPADVYNLWQGFGVKPVANESWDLIRYHLFTVVCQGDEKHYDWLVNWMAYCVQNPSEPAGSAVVMRGLKGVGKGVVATLMERIFCHHALRISNAKHLTGNFNAHLADTLFLYLDEAFFAPDKAGEGSLKTLITEKAFLVEPKGVNAYQCPNMLKILMSSNHDWVVPVTGEERRFFVLDVAPVHKNDKPYFDRLFSEIKGPGLGGLLDHLLKRDLTGWNHWDPPHTKALNDQKALGADSWTRYWRECLQMGEIIGEAAYDGWPDMVAKQKLHDAYKRYAVSHGDRYPVSIEWMGRKLRELSPGLSIKDKRPRANDSGTSVLAQRPWCFVLAGLKEHRDAYASAMKIDPEDIYWPDENAGDEH